MHPRGEAAARQAAVLALRASRGIEWEKFSARHGKSAAEKIASELKNFPEDLVQSGEKSTRLTPKGFRVGNAIWREIV